MRACLLGGRTTLRRHRVHMLGRPQFLSATGIMAAAAVVVGACGESVVAHEAEVDSPTARRKSLARDQWLEWLGEPVHGWRRSHLASDEPRAEGPKGQWVRHAEKT